MPGPPDTAGDIFGEHIGLEMEVCSRGEFSQGRRAEGFWNERHLEPVPPESRHRQRDSVERHAALGCHFVSVFGRQGESPSLETALGVDRHDLDMGVDVALDEMAADPVTESEGAFEIDRLSGSNLIEEGSVEGFR